MQIGEKPYKCAHCLFTSVEKGDLRRHERSHTGFLNVSGNVAMLTYF